MKNMTIAKGILLIVFAPIAPVIIYYLNELDIPLSDIIEMTLISYALGLITVPISLLSHAFIRNIKKGMIVSVSIAEVLYLAVLLVYMLVIDTENKAGNIMWLPVMIFFMIPFTLPMPLAISYGTGFIISEIKKKRA